MEMGKPMELKLLVMVVVAHVASAFFSKTIAGQKARSSKNWFWAGLIFGPLGLIAAVGLADRHQIVYLRHLAETQGYEPRHKRRRQSRAGLDWRSAWRVASCCHSCGSGNARLSMPRLGKTTWS